MIMEGITLPQTPHLSRRFLARDARVGILIYSKSNWNLRVESKKVLAFS